LRIVDPIEEFGFEAEGDHPWSPKPIRDKNSSVNKESVPVKELSMTKMANKEIVFGGNIKFNKYKL
jgi:hypothetical protein